MIKNDTISKADRTKQQIIEAAAVVFNKKGYAGTSISDITKATGLTKGSIYGNFRDKDDLALCVFHFNAGRVTEVFRVGLKKTRSAIETLLVIPDTFRMIFDDIVNNGGCPILNTLLEADDTHTLLYNEAKKTIYKLNKIILIAVENGKKKGEIYPGVNGQAIAHIVISLIEGASAMSKTMNDLQYFYDALDHVEQLIHSIQLNKLCVQPCG